MQGAMLLLYANLPADLIESLQKRSVTAPKRLVSSMQNRLGKDAADKRWAMPTQSARGVRYASSLKPLLA